MKKTILKNVIPLVAASALLTGWSVSAKDQVTKSFAWRGENWIVLDMSTQETGVVAWQIEEESGVGRHVGSYTCQGEGTLNLQTGQLAGTGCLIADNGDCLFWDLTMELASPYYTLIITGGTGRFDNAAGLWEGVTVEVERVPALPLVRIHYVNHGTGTITY